MKHKKLAKHRSKVIKVVLIGTLLIGMAFGTASSTSANTLQGLPVGLSRDCSSKYMNSPIELKEPWKYKSKSSTTKSNN